MESIRRAVNPETNHRQMKGSGVDSKVLNVMTDIIDADEVQYKAYEAASVTSEEQKRKLTPIIEA